MEIDLSSKIEGLLFYRGEEVSKKELSSLFNKTIEEIEQALETLEEKLKNRGIVLVKKDDSVVLGIASELGSLIEGIRKDELDKELSKAAVETLSIILYKDKVTRSEIDYIRGVNSSFILRNLLVRGLIEKIFDPKDSRRILYRPTLDALSFMGITSINELPNYDVVVSKLEEALKQEKEND